MSLLNLISNDEFNSQGFANRQYVQLGSGLSMQVLKAVDLNNGWVELTLQRYNSIKQESQITTHKVKTTAHIYQTTLFALTILFQSQR